MSDVKVTTAARSVSFTGPLLVAGLIMRYAMETTPSSAINYDTAGLICIVIALLPLMILLGILAVCGIALGAVFMLDAAGSRRKRKRTAKSNIRRIR